MRFVEGCELGILLLVMMWVLGPHAVQARISEEPAFAWWCPYVFRKRNRIISKVKSKYWQRTHKYGIRVPHSVKEAIAIDQANGNTV